MSEFIRFANSSTSGDANGAVKIWNSSSRSILEEYRKVRDDEDGDAWYSGDYGLFEKIIFDGVKNGDPLSLRVIETFISAGIMLNESDRSGNSPVGLLAMIGHKDLLEAAVLNGGDVNAGDKNALSCIFGARQLFENWREIADFLVGAGANVNGRPDQEPALFRAISKNQVEAIRYLANIGADTNLLYESTNKSRCGTAMHYSLITAFAYSTDLQTGKLLVELGGDPTVKNKEGFGAIDAFFVSDREPSDNVRDLVELYSSSEEWRKASWHLNTPSPSGYNPIRQQRSRNSNDERVWKELPGIVVTFRIGDRVEVIRRAGLYGNRVSLTLLEPSGEREFGDDLTAMPGTTGTIVSWSNEHLDFHWKAVIEFDPGNWEEVDNYGHIRSIGRSRGSLFADCLKITEIEEDRRPASRSSAPIPLQSSKSENLHTAGQSKGWKGWAAAFGAVLALWFILHVLLGVL